MADDITFVYDKRGNPFPVKASMLTPEAQQELIYNIPQGAPPQPPPDTAAQMQAPQPVSATPAPTPQPTPAPAPQNKAPQEAQKAPLPDIYRVPGGKPKMTADEQYMLDAKHREGQGALEQVDAQKAAQEGMTGLSKQVSDWAQNDLLQREERYKKREQMVQSDLQNLQARVEEYNSKRLDPNAGWNSKTTGQKVMAIIATFFGTMGGKRYDKDNPSPIQQIIDKDLEAQKIRMEEDKQRIVMSRQSIAYKQQALAGLDQEWEELQIKHLENFKHMADYLTQNAQGPEIEAKKKMLSAQIDQLERNALMNYKAAAARRAQGAIAVNIAPEGQAPVYTAMSGKDAGKFTLEKEKLGANSLEGEYKKGQIEKTRLDNMEKSQQLEPAIPGVVRTGEKATPPSAAELTKIRAGVGASRNLRHTLDQLQALAEKHWTTNRVWDPTDIATANALRDSAIAQYRVIENTGTPQEGEIKRFEARIPDPNSLSWTKKETFQALKDQAARRLQDELHPYGMALEDAAPSSWVPKE